MNIHTANRKRLRDVRRRQAAQRAPIQPGLAEACRLVTEFVNGIQAVMIAFHAALVPWATALKAEIDTAMQLLEQATQEKTDICEEVSDVNTQPDWPAPGI